jgi:acyl carrier protein
MSATGNTVLDKEDLRQTIATVVEADPAEVTDEALFIEDLGVDSLIALEVLVVLERKYGVKLDESRLTEITCLRRAYEVIAQELGEA